MRKRPLHMAREPRMGQERREAGHTDGRLLRCGGTGARCPGTHGLRGVGLGEVRGMRYSYLEDLHISKKCKMNGYGNCGLVNVPGIHSVAHIQLVRMVGRVSGVTHWPRQEINILLHVALSGRANLGNQNISIWRGFPRSRPRSRPRNKERAPYTI
jgi:hypothetical protein